MKSIYGKTEKKQHFVVIVCLGLLTNFLFPKESRENTHTLSPVMLKTGF